MADYNVLTDYGYFTIENDNEGDELWFHPLRGKLQISGFVAEYQYSETSSNDY